MNGQSSLRRPGPTRGYRANDDDDDDDAEIIFCEYCECISKTFPLIGNLKQFRIIKIIYALYILYICIEDMFH
jgi:hypothetical protein